MPSSSDNTIQIRHHLTKGTKFSTFLSVWYLRTYAVHVNDSLKRYVRTPGLNWFLNFGGVDVVNFVSVLLRADEEGVNIIFS